MSIETPSNPHENLIQGNLSELNNQIIQEGQAKNEKKESKKTPGKFEYIGNKKDKQNRNRKFYSYTLVQGGTCSGIIDRRTGNYNISDENFCDMDGNKIKKHSFNKGETVYIKIPNTDIIDPAPEMSSDEIMKLSKDSLYQIYLNYSNNNNFINHEDKNGYYTIINGKKLYYLQETLKNNRTYIDINAGEGDHYISIGRKIGNKISGVFYNEELDTFYKGDLEYNSYSLVGLAPQN